MWNSFPFLFSCLDYKSLGILKRQFPNTPLIGLTATATNHVLKDAQKILHVQKCITFTASFNRPNLYYEVCLNFQLYILIINIFSTEWWCPFISSSCWTCCHLQRSLGCFVYGQGLADRTVYRGELDNNRLRLLQPVGKYVIWLQNVVIHCVFSLATGSFIVLHGKTCGFVFVFFYGLLRCNLTVHKEDIIILVTCRTVVFIVLEEVEWIGLFGRLCATWRTLIYVCCIFEVRHKPSNNEDFIEDIVKMINGRYKGLSGKKLFCFFFLKKGILFLYNLQCYRNVFE